jgi:heme A synthase
MNSASNNSMPPRWLTWWAWLTVGAVLPLLFLGAIVTTLKVGMEDRRSFVWPHQAIFEMFSSERSLGWKIEHIHRLAGWFAGVCGIILAIGCLFCETGLRRLLGIAGLILITAQGFLGIFRVQLDVVWGRDLAWIHGCFAQIVFAVLAGIALMESPTWRSQQDSASPALRRWSLVCLGLVLGQLILGGMIRHQPSLLMARFHILGAFLVLGALLWLAKLAFDDSLRWMGWLLLGLVGVEIALGVETGVHWMARFFRPELAILETDVQKLTRTTHYVVGSLVFAVTTLVALKAHRGLFSLAGALPPLTREARSGMAPSIAGQTLQGGVA